MVDRAGCLLAASSWEGDLPTDCRTAFRCDECWMSWRSMCQMCATVGRVFCRTSQDVGRTFLEPVAPKAALSPIFDADSQKCLRAQRGPHDTVRPFELIEISLIKQLTQTFPYGFLISLSVLELEEF